MVRCRQCGAEGDFSRLLQIEGEQYCRLCYEKIKAAEAEREYWERKEG